MKKIAFNPYLPEWEHIPDAEPRVFGNRVYVFGSHDEDGGDEFCLLDYVCWSAPVDNLGDWRYEGVIYRKEQEPLQHDPAMPGLPRRMAAGLMHLLFAPDVVEGRDGRYYLYYSMDFSNVISVAVSETPAGPYAFLAHVKRADGTRPEGIRWFDPGVLCDASGVYLYMGSSPEARFPEMGDEPIPGGMGIRLADDMHTIIGEPFLCANGIETCAGTSYEAHPFFEASSIRHYGEWYYHIYSSLRGHELCYGMSRSPEGPFTYRGVLVSNADLGRNGGDRPQNHIGNNHGSMTKIGGKYYIFWHRHTHGGQFSRQGCADELRMRPDGSFEQAEITSCGLNGAPLPVGRSYRATIACCLLGPIGSSAKKLPLKPDPDSAQTIPYCTGILAADAADGYCSWIENLRPGAVFGYKFFDFTRPCKELTVTLRGHGAVAALLDSPDGRVLARFACASDHWTQVAAGIPPVAGTHAVYFKVGGDDKCRLACREFCFS